MFKLKKLLAFSVKRLVRCNDYCSSVTLLSQPLLRRVLIRLAGTDAANYLQGLVTNDINHIAEGDTGCMFAMFLNTKGRVLYDTIVYKSDDSFLIECDKEIAKDLAAHLKMYKVRRKLAIDVLDKELVVWNVLDTAVFKELTIKGGVVESKLLDVDGAQCFDDPRCRALGCRVIAPTNHPLEISGEKIPIGSNDYTQLRHKLGIAEGIHELPPTSCFPLESNCDYLHGVSFHKGCYLGQEVTARTHHTGVVRKRIMPIEFDQPLINAPFDALVTNEEGRAVGKLRGTDGNKGIALLRIEESLKAKELYVEGIRGQTHRPFWWPAEAPRERPN